MFGNSDNEGSPFGGFGHGFGRKHFFERGILKVMILDIIKERPRHGYDVIQELDSKFHSFYTPSAGSVYPILQLLEDQGFVTSNQEDGKTIYTITKDGKKELEKYEDKLKFMRDHMEKRFGVHNGGNFRELRGEVRETMQLIMRNAREGALKDPETMKELHAAFADFRSKAEKIFATKKK